MPYLELLDRALDWAAAVGWVASLMVIDARGPTTDIYKSIKRHLRTGSFAEKLGGTDLSASQRSRFVGVDEDENGGKIHTCSYETWCRVQDCR